MGDPYEQVPERVWEVCVAASMLDRGIDVMPEAGGWMDQPAAWCGLVEFVLAERSRMKRAAEQAAMERMTG